MKLNWDAALATMMVVVVAFGLWFFAVAVQRGSRLAEDEARAKAICDAFKAGDTAAVIERRCYTREGGQWVDRSAEFEARP